MSGKEQFEAVGDGLLVRAPAKINLSLLVGARRSDGYHEIETIMAKVNLYDEILIRKGKSGGIELLCEGRYSAPPGRDNLVYNAVELLCRQAGLRADIEITLTKNIPAGAGLGGASSDAAATLIGVNRFLELGFDRPSLSRIAARLGSDVPFFLNGPLAHCSSRGEKVSRLSENYDFFALLILPAISVSTKMVYDNYEYNSTLYDNLHEQINTYLLKNRIDLIAGMCANMLRKSCFDLYNELAKLFEMIENDFFVRVCLSGSGSALFCIFDSLIECEKKRDKLEQLTGCRCIIVSNNRW